MKNSRIKSLLNIPILIYLFGGILALALISCSSSPVASPSKLGVRDGLKVSDNHHYLVDAVTGTAVFILADTAWNLGALKLEGIDIYLQGRADRGFNTVMFAFNLSPQADEKNAYGQAAYIGAEKMDLNPAYFEFCDAIV